MYFGAAAIIRLKRSLRHFFPSKILSARVNRPRLKNQYNKFESSWGIFKSFVASLVGGAFGLKTKRVVYVLAEVGKEIFDTV